MKKVLLSLVALWLLSTSVVLAEKVTYTPDNKTVFRNPERGFTEELSYKVSDSHPNVVKGNISSSWGASEKRSLVVVLYNFNKFKSKDLSDKVLAGFDEDMQELRKYGLKCVLRFAYTETENDKVDATPEWVKRHLEQLKPHLAANADVIYVLEAGFVGVWGEWYYTANYGNESQHMNSKRRKVVQYLFDNAPEDRFILFRYSMLKTEYFGDKTALSAAEGFSGTMRARWGCHNDAFLNNWGNDGTYASTNKDDDPAVRAYVAQETLYVPNGGETNVESSSLAESVYTKAPAEMAEYHWSFCGTSYATQVTGRWRSSGIFDTLNVHMGYRYNLLEGKFGDEAAPTGKLNVSIRLRNDGYAPIYNERPVYLVLKSNQNSEFSIQLKADPRWWLPNGRVSWISEQVTIPADLPEGTYHLYLYMPDKYEAIRDDARYAVRLANKNIWDENTGYNDLGAEVVISNQAPLDPGVLPEGVEVVINQPSVVSPRKVIQDGIFYIVMPDGKKHYCL